MCKYDDVVMLYVPIPAYLSYTGAFRWDYKGIDRCIAPIIEALNAGGVYTANSCCGHGEEDGTIHLHDGRILVVKGDSSGTL